VTSVVPRARETAIAMGFAVDHEIVSMATDESVYAELEANRWGTQPSRSRPWLSWWPPVARHGSTPRDFSPFGAMC